MLAADSLLLKKSASRKRRSMNPETGKDGKAAYKDLRHTENATDGGLDAQSDKAIKGCPRLCIPNKGLASRDYRNLDS